MIEIKSQHFVPSWNLHPISGIRYALQHHINTASSRSSTINNDNPPLVSLFYNSISWHLRQRLSASLTFPPVGPHRLILQFRTRSWLKHLTDFTADHNLELRAYPWLSWISAHRRGTIRQEERIRSQPSDSPSADHQYRYRIRHHAPSTIKLSHFPYHPIIRRDTQ